MTARTSPAPETSPYAPRPEAPRRGDAIDQWLGMFTRFLRVPAEQRSAIRDELDSHVRERVRDLMLAGLNEDEGVRRAIDELGEAAELAAHFNAAHKPTRRTLMSIATLGVAATAAVVSIVALNQTQPTAEPQRPGSGLAYQVTEAGVAMPGSGASPAGVPVLKDVPIVGKMFVPTQSGGTVESVRVNGKVDQPSVRSLASMLAQSSGKRLSLNAGDVNVDKPLKGVELVDADARTLLREMNDRAELLGDQRFDYRIRGDVMEVAPAQVFDKAETALVAYDVTEVFHAQASRDDLRETITQFVEPDGWRDNGGNTAQLKIVGNRLFVQAPPRYQAGVSWILDQFAHGSKVQVPSAAPAGSLAPAALPAAFPGGSPAKGPAAADLDLQRAEFLRREIAWTKVRLGAKLSAEEMALLDNRSVQTPQTAAEVTEARAQLDSLTEELALVTANARSQRNDPVGQAKAPAR